MTDKGAFVIIYLLAVVACMRGAAKAAIAAMGDAAIRKDAVSISPAFVTSPINAGCDMGEGPAAQTASSGTHTLSDLISRSRAERRAEFYKELGEAYHFNAAAMHWMPGDFQYETENAETWNEKTAPTGSQDRTKEPEATGEPSGRTGLGCNYQEAYELITNKLNAATNRPVILSWDDAEKLKAALAAQQAEIEELYAK